MPAVRGNPLVVYAVVHPGQPTPDVTCELSATSSSWVGLNLDYSLVTPESKGRVLKAVAEVHSGWNNGDTLTCTGDGVTTFVLGRNAGRTYQLQGLLVAFLAFGSGVIALIGFASRRHRSRQWPPPGPDRSRE
jgi:hypothetical protein